VLAGVGLALATGGQEPYDGRRLSAARVGVLARAVVLMGLGLLLGQVDSPPLVILAYYGLLFVVAVPCLGLPTRTLAILAVVSATVAPALSHVVRMHLDIAPIDEPGGSDLFAELLLTGTCPVLPWTTYLFVGLALGRLDLRRRATARRRRSGTRRRGEARVLNPARCSGGSGPAAGLRVAGLRVRLPGG